MRCSILAILGKGWGFPGIGPGPFFYLYGWPGLFQWPQMVKNLSAMQETWVPSLGCEDPLEKGMATHSSMLAWRIPWTEEPEDFSPWVQKEPDTTERPSLH